MARPRYIYVPKWAVILYGLLGIVFVPWIINLAANLPPKHVNAHWDAMWVGFDVIILLTIIISLWFMLKKQIWIIISAAALATLFLVDAWFDILTSKPGREQKIAILFGILELTMSALTYKLVYDIIQRSNSPKVQLVAKDQ